MQSTLYERVGGEVFFARLIAGFYARVASDPVLRPMYPEDLDAAERRLQLFLGQYFGGPPTYNEERGHPRLRQRHFSFMIDERAKEIWLGHMFSALAEVITSFPGQVGPEDESAIRSYLQDTANFLVNHGGLSLRG